MEMDYHFDGFEDVERAMRALPELVASRVQGDGLIAAARVVAAQAIVNVPEDTGALKASIRARRRPQRIETLRGRRSVPGAAARVQAGGPGARHAMLIELGTIKAAAQPYLTPALFETHARQISAAREGMARAVVKLGRDLSRGTASRTIARLAAD